jgi:transposase
MTKSQIEVITSVERRRRWTAAEKEQLVAASLEPDAVVSALAREAGVHPSQLYAWRRALCARRAPAAPDFAAVRIASDAVAAAVPAPLGVIEIEFAGGARMRISGPVDAPTLSAAVAALALKDRPR